MFKKLILLFLISNYAIAIEKIDLKKFQGTKLTKLNVIELYSEECPFTQRQYQFVNLQLNQDFFLSKGVNWFVINLSASKIDLKQNKNFSHLSENLLKHFFIIEKDSFQIAKSLKAKVTPTVFLFDQTGKILYSGSVESSDPFSKLDVKVVNNYLISAFNEFNEQKEVSHKYIKSIGCPIKYP